MLALVIIAASGCSYSPRSQDLAVLDQAYKSGAISQDEYESKKAGLESQATVLDALDKAVTASMVSPTDYLVIKARLIAKGGA